MPFAGEMFGVGQKGLADALEQSPLAATVAQGVPLTRRRTLVDHGRSEFYDVESIQDGEGFAQFVADRVGAAHGRGSSAVLDAYDEPGAAVFERSA